MPEPMAKAAATVRIDNERVRVTEWRFAPGAETGEHVHQMDYVVVPLGDGRLKIVSPAGEESFAQMLKRLKASKKDPVLERFIIDGENISVRIDGQGVLPITEYRRPVDLDA